MPDVGKFECCYTDPSVFDQRTQQEKGKEPKTIVRVYEDEGVRFLTRFHKPVTINLDLQPLPLSHPLHA